VFLYAHAVAKMLEEGKDPTDGALLKEALLDASETMTGVTGPMAFDRQSKDRDAVFSMRFIGGDDASTTGTLDVVGDMYKGRESVGDIDTSAALTLTGTASYPPGMPLRADGTVLDGVELDVDRSTVDDEAAVRTEDLGGEVAIKLGIRNYFGEVPKHMTSVQVDMGSYSEVFTAEPLEVGA
jgi:hypothetical protein